MTDTKHTPTPWKVYQFGGVQIGQEDTGEAICSMWGDKHEGEANAAHIVKCVNLHDALVEALERVIVYMKEEFNNIDDTGEEFSIVEQAEEALKKAGAL